MALSFKIFPIRFLENKLFKHARNENKFIVKIVKIVKFTFSLAFTFNFTPKFDKLKIAKICG